MKSLFRTYLILFVFSLVVLSCTKEEQDFPAPLKEVIASQDDCTCEPYINQYLWKSKTVYALAFKGPACDTRPLYFDEKGVEFSMPEGFTFDDFLKESNFIKNIWTCLSDK